MSASGARPGVDQRLTVFLSYSRDDLALADQIHATLLIGGYRPLIDREGIKVAEQWEQRLRDMVLSADTVLVLLSPSWLASPACQAEVDWALAQGKRIIPAVCRPLGDAAPHPALAALNYIYLYPEPRKSGTSLASGLLELREALEADIGWLREHTRLLQKASEWQAAGRPAIRLLSGSDIGAAKAWAARQPREAPAPTELHLAFIRASEDEEQRRQDAERQRLEEMAAAQAAREAALVAKEQAQQQEAAAREREALQARRVVQRTRAGLAASLLFALAAGGFGYVANTQRIKAERALQQVRSNAAARVEALVQQVELQRLQAAPGPDGAASAAPAAAPPVAELEALATSAETLLDRGQLAEARATAERGLTGAAGAAEAPPGSDLRQALAGIRLLRAQGIAAARQGPFSRDLATQSLLAALERAQALALAAPQARPVREALATALQDAGDFGVETALAAALAAASQAPAGSAPDVDTPAFAQAQGRLERLLRLRAEDAAAAPGADTRLALATAHNRLANLEAVRGRVAAFDAHAGRAIETLTKPAPAQRPADLRELCVGYYFKAAAAGSQGRPDEALQWIDQVVRIAGEQAAATPQDATLRQRLSVALARRAEWQVQQQSPKQALASLERAIDEALRAVDLAGRHRPEWMRDAAALMENRAQLLFAQDQTGAAIDSLWQGLALREQAAALSSSPQWQDELFGAYKETRRLLNERGRPAAGLEVAEQQLFSVALAPCTGGDAKSCRTEQVDKVAETLTQLGWTALLAANPSRALWATQRALALAPRTDGARLNHAHALMLTGARDEAARVYLEGPAAPFTAAELKDWRASVLDDFRTLRGRGVSDPLMADIERRFQP